MSAIDTTFHWVRNPTAINGLQTTYCSKRGSDVSGDGTAQNPYASIAKATSVATSGTNIMLDDGEWKESITSNNKNFIFWGNTNTILLQEPNFVEFKNNTKFHFFKNLQLRCSGGAYIYIYDSYLSKMNGASSPGVYWFVYNCIIDCNIEAYRSTPAKIYNCVCSNKYNPDIYTSKEAFNCVFCGSFSNNNFVSVAYCNFTIGNIPSNAVSCINDSITGQTIADYFNKYDANDWLKCDFTAKEGSKNIGAGEKGTTIGLNQGYTMYADNSANDMFSPSNGATLKNIAWDSNLNGYTLVQKERVCQGATSTTITLDSNASAVDDYYNNLFIGIVGGDGYGELFLITDYDGATKTATIDGSWNTTPNTNSIYTISGTILSAIKDFGKAIKVKRNWTFADSFTTLADGQWAEFMTHVETNGKQFPVSCYSYEYSTDGVNFVQGQTADDLVSATNGENKVTDNIYGDCSANYNEATAKNLIMRYIRVRVHIGFNI